MDEPLLFRIGELADVCLEEGHEDFGLLQVLRELVEVGFLSRSDLVELIDIYGKPDCQLLKPIHMRAPFWKGGDVPATYASLISQRKKQVPATSGDAGIKSAQPILSQASNGGSWRVDAGEVVHCAPEGRGLE